MVKAHAEREENRIAVSLEIGGTALEIHREFSAIVQAFTQAMLNRVDEGREQDLIIILGKDLLQATSEAYESYLDLKKQQEVGDG